MAKFRKKPVVIEAVQFTVGFFLTAPQDFLSAVCTAEACADTPTTARPHIHTLEGTHYITAGDYIIRGVKGEFYPCKPDIFAATYEAVEEASNAD